MSIAGRLAELGITLPEPAQPRGLYTPAVRSGNLLFISGQLPTREGTLVQSGKLGRDLTVEQGQQAARQAVLNALAITQQELGGLDAVRRVVRMVVYVASAEGFVEQPQVANGASQVLIDLFGEQGRHARVAMGAAELPANAPVEIELLVEITP
ncbi:MAG: RidA family protein [Chloroflexi bacterium]|nr:RidA family protein [Chloroflexota bacterium]